MYVVENSMKRKVDDIVPKIANILQISHYPWDQISSIGSLVFLGMTGLMLFARSDLVNLLIAAICYYATSVDRKQLEEKNIYICIMLAGSLFYDLLWFAFCGSVPSVFALDRTFRAASVRSAGTNPS